MSFISSLLLRKARETVRYRKRVYGIDPAERIARILETDKSLSVAEFLVLAKYILFVSPRALVRLAWRYLADYDTPRRRRLIGQLASDLRSKLSPDSRVVETYFERRLYSRDLARVPQVVEKLLHRTTPLLAVQPGSADDVIEVLRFAARKTVPIYPRGIASSAFGGAVPTMNGIVIDFSPLTKVLHLDCGRRLVTVEPGVRWSELAEYLQPYGLAPITTPTSFFSTVAGWASTGGLGVNGFRYGHFRDAIYGMRVALPNGSVLELTKEDSRLQDFIGTEGQFGVILSLTIRVKPVSSFARDFLYYFDTPASAFEFVETMTARDHEPAHVAFYDHVRLREENAVFCDRNKVRGGIVEERDAVFLHFDDRGAAERFAGDAELQAGKQADLKGARYLWAERFFPLKAQRLGPSLLASEVVLPRKEVPSFVEFSRKLARSFGVEIAYEVLVSQVSEKQNCVTIGSFFCDSRSRGYSLLLLLVQLLTYFGVQRGGRPYGFGIWNSPFLNLLFHEEVRARMLARKKEYDPRFILNPQKFFGVRSRLYNIPGLLFAPRVHEASLRLAYFFLPLVGLIARMLKAQTGAHWVIPSAEEKGGEQLLRETQTRCTSCGACISVCPAYLVTHEELVTGRAKLRTAEALLSGEEVLPQEAFAPFQCLQCGLCEEVCQTNLPLRACYRALEQLVEKRYGRPEALIKQFMEKVDRNPDVVARAYGLSKPAWRPPVEPAPRAVNERGGK